MKIGILTLPFNNNYGGYLQCFALMTVLRGLGHEVTLINRRPAVKFKVRGYIKGFIKNRILGDKSRVYNTSSFEARYRREGARMLPFVEKHISPRTPPIYSLRGYRCLKDYAFDAIVVGSDQVWRPRFVPDVREFFLPQISDEIVKIAYAASFGTDELEYEENLLRQCTGWLKSFRAVSVREESGINLLKKYFNYNEAISLVDPTMLLAFEEYKEIFSLKDESRNKDIFAYVLDITDEKKNMLRKYSSMLNSDVVCFNKGNRFEPKPSIQQWIDGIYNSKLVITDSFHGTVFSILLNRPFYTIKNEMRGNSRLVDLLFRFGLEDRLISSFNDVSSNSDISWNEVNRKLDIEQCRAINFLKNNLV